MSLLRLLVPVMSLTLLGYGLVSVWVRADSLLALLLELWPRILQGLLLVLLSFGIKFSRWCLLLAALGQHPPLLANARIWMGSFAFTATPGKSGEAVRSLLLKQECEVPVPPTLMALVVERLTDAMSVLLILLINFPLLMSWSVPITVPIAIGIIVVSSGWLVLSNRRVSGLLKTGAKRLLPLKLANAGGDGLSALRQLLRPGLLLQATAIGALAWSMEGVSLWLLLRGMDIDSVSIGGATIAHTAAGLLGALTLMPGGLGSTEAGTVGLLALQGVGVATAIPATLLIRLMTLWFATTLGVCCLLLPGRPRRLLHE